MLLFGKLHSKELTMFGKYNKFVSALLAALVVAIPAFIAASQDGTVSLQEWLTVIGMLIVPPGAVALSPANKLPTEQLVKQAIENPDINLQVEGRTTIPPAMR